MSEKKWKFDSRVPHKERGGRRGKGSGFPRHGMNEYEGERLAMGRHRFSNHRTQTHNKRHGWASLHKKHIDNSIVFSIPTSLKAKRCNAGMCSLASAIL